MMPLVIVVEDVESAAVSQSAFIKSPVRIGRSELNDLPLPLPFVSSWHAVVQFDDREVHYVDLGSTNGSVLDGNRLERNVPAPVAPESEIRIGTLRLRFARRAAAAAPQPQRPITQFALHVSQLGLSAPAAAPALPPEAAPPLPQPQVEVVEQALANAAMDVDLLYASYRGAWEHLRGTVEQLLVGMDAPTRALALSRLAEKYDAVSQERQFRTLLGEPEAPPGRAAPAGRGVATGFLSAFAQSYLPAPEQASTAEGAERLLGRTAEVLEAFGKSYVELRKGYEEFGREMGVRAVRTESPVERARDAHQLLGYLLDLRAEGSTGDLQSAFADLMLHQVALLNGVVEGARGILDKLSPDAVAAESPQVVWPMKAASHWKAYEARWHEIADEEDGISDALFGTEFARAYTTIVGKRAEEGNGSAKPAARPARPVRPMPAQPRRS